MTTALLQQALDALETCVTLITRQCYSEVAVNAAAKDIRSHLAQPQGEPVAWMHTWPNHAPSFTTDKSDYVSWFYGKATYSEDLKPLYLHPAHTEREVQELLDASYRESGALESTVRRILNVPPQEPAP